MTGAGRIRIWMVTVIAALLVAAILFVALFNWNHARPWLNQTLSSSIGREVAINGELSVSNNVYKLHLNLWRVGALTHCGRQCEQA